VKQIRTDPTTSFLREVAHLMESLHWLISEIERQHTPELRSFAIKKVNLTGYTDEHNMLQAMITLKKRQGVEIGLDQITGLALAFCIGNSTLSTDSGHEYQPVMSSEQQKWGHVLRSNANHESNILVANKPLESHARSQLRCLRHVDHDKFQLRDDKENLYPS